ncbi:MAG: hypothetical protein AAGG55_10440 [Pseudomonadota bacterium]
MTIRSMQRLFTALFLGHALIAPLSAHAHLMPSGKGTLNVTDTGVFLVLALPLSAFRDIDENGDGVTSLVEFNMRRDSIIERIESSVWLEQDGERLTPRHIMLSPQATHHGNHADTDSGVEEIAVLARFPRDAQTPLPEAFGVSVYGPSVQAIEVRASHRTMGLASTFTVSADAVREAISW